VGKSDSEKKTTRRYVHLVLGVGRKLKKKRRRRGKFRGPTQGGGYLIGGLSLEESRVQILENKGIVHREGFVRKKKLSRPTPLEEEPE